MLLLAPMLALVVTVGDDTPAPVVPPPKIAKPSNGEAPQPDQSWNLSLGEAVRLGLTNTPVVQIVTSGATPAPTPDLPIGYKELMQHDVKRPTAGPNGVNLVVAPGETDLVGESLRAALLAHVRSVEQQYWALALAVSNQALRAQAAEQAQELVKREKNDFEGRGGAAADIAEAEERLENCQLNLVTATADLVTVEQGMRHLLGLPATDNRRIIPCTPALAAQVTPDWEASLAQMYAFQPDICAQRVALVAVALREALILDRSPATADQRTTLRQDRERQQDQLAQATRQATQVLSRFFPEVDANYQLFQTAQQREAKMAQRLKAQQAFYAEGRITIDRLLDAVIQQTTAAAQARQYQMAYNTSIAALAEATGTLLDHYGVTVVQTPTPTQTPVARIRFKNDAEVKPTSGPVELPR